MRRIPIGPVPDHEFGTIVRTDEETERRVQEVVDAREKLLRNLDESNVYHTDGQIHWDMAPGRIPAHRGLTVLTSHVALFNEAPGEPEEVVVTHPLRGVIRDPATGEPKTKMRALFQVPPFMQLNWDSRHDGEKWDLRLELVDLRHGTQGAREPVFTHEAAGGALSPLVDEAVPAILARISDFC